MKKSPILLNGTWETKKRSITAAAVTALIVVGAIYFNAQSFLAIVFMLIASLFDSAGFSNSFSGDIGVVFEEYKTPILLAVTVTQYLFMLLPAIWIIKKWHTTDIKKYARWNSCSLKETFLAIIITITSLPFAYFISYKLMDALNVPKMVEELGAELFTATSSIEFFVLVFVIAFTPALCEEFFFRGYFQRTMERTTGAKSVLIGGVLFGLYHLNPIGLFVLVLLGILFSFYYYRSKSLIPGSAAHFTNNFLAILLMYVQVNSTEESVFMQREIPLWLVLSSIIITGLLLMIYIKITEGIEEPEMVEVKLEENNEPNFFAQNI